MGHLINPIAFRLGFKKSWEHIWYVKNIYYPEYLHNILNIRNYIYYALLRKSIIQTGILLSHLFILKYNKLIIINIYIYHTDLEKLSYKFFNRMYEAYYKKIKDKNIKLPLNFFIVHNSDVFIYIFLFYNLFFKLIDKKIENKNKFINMHLNLNIFANKLLNCYNDLLVECMNKSINNNNNNFYDNYKNKINEILNTNEFIYLKGLVEKINADENYIIKNNYMANYFFYFFLYLCRKIDFRKYNNSFNFYIKWSVIIKLLSYYKNIYYKNKENNYNYFYLLILIGAYMSRKLKEKNIKFYTRDFLYNFIYIWLGKRYFFPYFKSLSYYWKILFYYINKLKNININYHILSNFDITASFLTKYIGLKLQKGHNLFRILNPLKRELYKLYKYSKEKKKDYKIYFKYKIYNYKLVFIKILNLINIILYLWNFNFYKKNKTFLSFDIIEFKQYILKEKLESNNIKLFYIKKFISINIFYNIFLNINNNKLYIIELLNDYNYINNIFYSIYINNNVLYNNIYKYKKIYTNVLYLSINFTKLYLNYNYYKILWLKLIGFKKKIWKNKDENDVKSVIIGYKMSFKGRFSRKQRASSIWFTHGKVPLNTINNIIDYSFFTVPLRNSAVSIKIWIHKNMNYSNYKYIMKY